MISRALLAFGRTSSGSRTGAQDGGIALPDLRRGLRIEIETGLFARSRALRYEPQASPADCIGFASGKAEAGFVETDVGIPFETFPHKLGAGIAASVNLGDDGDVIVMTTERRHHALGG